MPAAPTMRQRLHEAAEYLSVDLFGGPRPWKLSWIVNAQKGGMLPFLLVLAWWTDNQSAAAWTYLALHGGYGVVWVLKDVAFPDPRWQRRTTIAGGIASVVGVLGWYSAFGWLMFTRPTPVYPLPEPLWLACCVLVCVVGVAVMIASDAQKTFTLRARPGLITDGMFRYVRHPNYAGEMLIYASFAMLVQHWLPWVVLAAVWGLLFLPSLAAKEQRMARHPGWAAYRQRTWWLVPGLF
jgi:protein-S-isoprenylcysteine O-methyltransferase Ste14